MSQNSQLIKISKYLSYHLRHHPEEIGLELEPGGWVAVEALLAAAQAHQYPITRSQLDLVVETNNKQRFSFDSTGTRIRANQGHSIPIDLQLKPRCPPDILYHGTRDQAVESILAQGLQKKARHHVHLSPDIDTARQVGMRHGKPVVFIIKAAEMYQNGHLFYCSDNGVWLVDEVPPEYLVLA
ncbi:RNA 2'-phosphotransferase [Laspinema olomoucense]|uniref:RNA 2'-phosphotransferase n=1 Tax=Laspinema olomoucense TaxID=3231600 RepID=UPI0021BAC149|nr:MULTISPECIES: RNA 2'-phosphotransferase [unclassified Laspinema]MCT7970895.1 RNA 2'-phosphotransferase [Laspinema sp. D3d]MCT7993841.1 RNA 2'-phosphotransferase [Laspinema sp. D3c]